MVRLPPEFLVCRAIARTSPKVNLLASIVRPQPYTVNEMISDFFMLSLNESEVEMVSADRNKGFNRTLCEIVADYQSDYTVCSLQFGCELTKTQVIKVYGLYLNLSFAFCEKSQDGSKIFLHRDVDLKFQRQR